MSYKTLTEFNKALPTETAKRFKVVGLKKRATLSIYFAKWGQVNFPKLSVKRAEQLIKQDFPYLKPVEKTKAGKE